MSIGRQRDRYPFASNWQVINRMGESLASVMELSDEESWSIHQTIVSLCEIFIKTIEQLLTAEVKFWFSEDEVKRFVGKSFRIPDDTADSVQFGSPPSYLPQDFFPERKVYSLPLGQSKLEEFSTSNLSTLLEMSGSTTIIVPLFLLDYQETKSTVLGFCQIVGKDDIQFTPEIEEFLFALGSQISLYLQNKLRKLADEWRREQFSLVNQVSNQLADFHDLRVLFPKITKLIQGTFDYYYVAIFTIEPGEEKLQIQASVKQHSEHELDSVESEHPPVFEISKGEGIVGTVALSEREVLANNVQRESLYRHEDALYETRSEVALPLIVNERVLGVLDVQSDLLNAFSDTDMSVLRTLAGNISIAIEGIRLFDASQKKASQLAIIQKVTSKITSILDQKELLNEVVDLIVSHFGYPHVHIFTIHPGRRKVILEAGSQLDSQKIQAEYYVCNLDDQSGLIPWVARNGVTEMVNDVNQNPLYTPLILGLENVRSELTVPLKFGGEVLGVLDIQSDHLAAFDAQDRFIIEALSDNIAIALRNAYLYRSEVWRRRVSDSLREVAGLLSMDVDLEGLLSQILIELQHTLPMDLAAIWLVDENHVGQDIKDSDEFYLAALQGSYSDDLDIEIGFSPYEILQYNPCDPQKLVAQDVSRWLQIVLKAAEPVVRSPDSPFDPLGACLGFNKNYAAIAAPLLVEAESLGVMVLIHHSVGRYGNEARALMTAFASSAAVAIKNIRLYEAAHEQAWISTVLLQVAEATQSQTNLKDLLSTVIRITPMLVGIKSCLIYLYDEDEMFTPATASGLTPEQEAEFERWRFAPGDVSAFDQLLVDRTHQVLRDHMGNQRLFNLFKIDASLDQSEKLGLLVLVPMMARDQMLGVLLVDYSGDLWLGMPGKTLEGVLDERLAIIQGIAQQTAIAIDNLKLLKSQKEEAYISVALLQVAQAVVSSNDLDEVLAAIVRVTPILVGVKRTAVFLWDETRKIFRLSQSYGLHIAETERELALGSFALLDAVLVENDLFVCPISSQDKIPENALDYWKQLSAPDSQDVADYIEEEAQLLLAFPLAVKSKMFGAFIVEEPDPAPIGYYAGGHANQRLRARRLEIVKGISQQAALAIQNEMFQKETVERERLEREMQLARQIQTMLLPGKLEHLDGWDLQVIWQPEREVGGDFFDFFELPGERLGIVIADVADKGIPAAMYMTLARTLVRSMAPQIMSPGRVLERVNDYLVVDTPAGMFVTLVYIILSMKTGDLIIANAGHNPPLILHTRSKKIKRITRGGMALGVEEGEQIRESRASLRSGEFLILYTDGVTEAFSPQEEVFGEERLHNTIQKAIIQENSNSIIAEISALELLRSIESAVEEFLEDQKLSDDLTLLVLKKL